MKVAYVSILSYSSLVGSLGIFVSGDVIGLNIHVRPT